MASIIGVTDCKVKCNEVKHNDELCSERTNVHIPNVTGKKDR
jgi:hypothetical protein